MVRLSPLSPSYKMNFFVCGGWANPLQTLSQGLVLTLRFMFGPDLDDSTHSIVLCLSVCSSVVKPEFPCFLVLMTAC